MPQKINMAYAKYVFNKNIFSYGIIMVLINYINLNKNNCF